MSKIEKIRAEIERRKNICESVFERGADTYYQGKAVAYGELLPFLDTLSEEPDKSLEEAARRYAIPAYMKDVDENYLDEYPYDPVAEKAFKAGAEWQKSQMLKDAVEGRVFMSFAPGHNQMVMADVDLPTNTKVRIVVLKAEED